MYIGPAVDRVNDRRQPLRPGLGAASVGDQVLADLDQRMGEAVDDGVLEHGVAAQRAVIGLVVADDQVCVGLASMSISGRATRSSQIPQHADMPGR